MPINKETRVYAGFFVRFGAFLIDSFIVSVALLAVKIPMNYVTFLVGETQLTRPILFQYSLWDIVLYLLGVMYFTIMTYYTGTTIGKKIFRIRVVSANPEENLRLFDVFYRETIGRFFCTASLCFGYLLVGIDYEKRGLHDIVSDTRVIYNLKVLERVIILKQTDTDINLTKPNDINREDTMRV